MSAAPARRTAPPLGQVLQRPVMAPAFAQRQGVLQPNRAPAQLSLFERPNGR